MLKKLAMLILIGMSNHIFAAPYKAPYVKNGRYYNRKKECTESHMYWTKEVLIYLTAFIQRMLHIDSRNPIFANKRSWVTKGMPQETAHEPVITWVGHATFLIQVGGCNILTDPIFGDAFPVVYQRILPPGIELQHLPPIHKVIISHNHRDHMNEETLMYLKKHHPNAAYLVPQGVKAWFDEKKFTTVSEYTWWQQHTDSEKNITFSFLPAHHWSQRNIVWSSDRNSSLWGSWMIEHNGFTLYFAGDTAYNEHFKEIAKAFPHIDVALLPIAPCEHRILMKDTHMGPEEAGQAFLDLGAHQFIPMHWGTYYFGVDHFTTPIERIALWWSAHHKQLVDKELHFIKMGEQLTDLVAKQGEHILKSAANRFGQGSHDLFNRS